MSAWLTLRRNSDETGPGQSDVINDLVTSYQRIHHGPLNHLGVRDAAAGAEKGHSSIRLEHRAAGTRPRLGFEQPPRLADSDRNRDSVARSSVVGTPQRSSP